ncbi:enoyl-CoA hydratase-related protein [Pseudonocardia hispaniensis]|uniref:Enoyl-CoA hydratase-related protein n=1 Tax=Pseudonocardia hispaniensis TaxID=904933 RepID=A0ABW1J3N8_9PSEU
MTAVPANPDTRVETSGADAEVARRLYDALAAGDTASLGDLLAPEFVGRLADGMPVGVGGEHKGPDEMWRAGWGEIGRHFAVRAVPERFHTVEGGRLLVLGRYRGSGRRGGAELDAGFAHLLTLSEGRITALEQFTDTALWRQAAAPYETLRLTVADGLATVLLDRPAQHNAVDARMGADLVRLTRALAAHRSVRAVLLTGAGPMFSVGGDIEHFRSTAATDLPGALGAMVDDISVVIERLAALDAPVVAAVQGAAAGVGLALVCVSDVVIAAQDAVFTVGYGGIGLTADGGLSWTLPRLVGERRARELLLTGRRLSAAEALDWGLVTRVVPADRLAQEARAEAIRIAAGPTAAFGAVRRLLRDSHDTPLHEQLLAERESIVAAGRSADLQEGLRAFTERRRPDFTGR